MAVRVLEVGDLAVNCYLVWPDEAAPRAGAALPAVVVDPGAEARRIDAALRDAGLALEAVLLTHAHADHIGAVDELLGLWPGAVLACSAETSRRAGDPRLNLSVFLGEEISARPAARPVRDGEEFTLAAQRWRAVEIPGHDPGELVYIRNGGLEVFTGDTVFSGSVGRSDFPGGDGRALVAGVRALLAALPPEARLYPGHGPATSAEAELAHNPFLTAR